MLTVRPHQSWRIASSHPGAPPITIRILSVGAVLAEAETARGTRISVRIRTLAHGLRHATILEEAPGYPKQERIVRERVHLEKERTASDYRKVTKPRGEPTPISAKAYEAERLSRRGMTARQIAKLKGVSPHTVWQWIARVRDERKAKKTGT
jgi:hypothetical protein